MLVCLAATLPLIWFVPRYPFGPAGISLALAAYAGLLLWRQQAWLFLLPAILPVAGLASWTGWIHVDEFDLFVCVTLLLGYGRIALASQWPRPRGQSLVRPNLIGMALVSLLALSYLASMAVAVAAHSATPIEATGTYLSAQNSARVFKPFLLAALVFPLVHLEIRAHREHALRVLAWGIAVSVLLVAAFVVWERAAFLDQLLNFSVDYRASGPFWEMHVGGATIDFFLVLALPVTARLVTESRGKLAMAVAAGIILTGLYAVMATKTRTTYIAVFVQASILIGAGFLARRDGNRTVGAPPPWLSIGLIAVASILLTLVFPGGGYRELAAGAGLLIAAVLAPDATRLANAGVTVLLLVFGAVLASVALWLTIRNVYLLYAAAWFAFLLSALSARRRPWFASVASASFLSLCGLTVLVQLHNRGALDGPELIALVALAIAFWGWGRRHAQVLWRSDLRSALGTSLIVLLLCLIAVGAGGYGMRERFSSSSQDWAARTQHFHAAMATRGDGLERVFGSGLGQFPARYFWHARDGNLPGDFTIRSEGQNRYLQVSGHGHFADYGEQFRISQRVQAAHRRGMRVALDVRATKHEQLIRFEICEKHLIYAWSWECPQTTVKVPPGVGWQHVEAAFDQRVLGGGPWYAPRLMFFTLASGTANRTFDLDNIRLTDDYGASLLRNGGFHQGGDHWFFTSDRNHLPWQTKNLWVDLLVEHGWFGVAAFGLVFLGAFSRCARGIVSGMPLAPQLVAVMAGVLLVGLSDALLNSPRATFLMYLLLFLSLSLQPSLSPPRQRHMTHA